MRLQLFVLAALYACGVDAGNPPGSLPVQSKKDQSKFLKVLETVKIGDPFPEVGKKCRPFSFLQLDWPVILCDNDTDNILYAFVFDPEETKLFAVIRYSSSDDLFQKGKGTYVLPRDKAGKKTGDEKLP